ncbi:hypothetical protein Csa_015957 [Cucumis sativus]|nr:hypothetical protein Csa_015957 [Cucumis sativus]
MTLIKRILERKKIKERKERKALNFENPPLLFTKIVTALPSQQSFSISPLPLPTPATSAIERRPAKCTATTSCRRLPPHSQVLFSHHAFGFPSFPYAPSPIVALLLFVSIPLVSPHLRLLPQLTLLSASFLSLSSSLSFLLLIFSSLAHGSPSLPKRHFAIAVDGD